MSRRKRIQGKRKKRTPGKRAARQAPQGSSQEVTNKECMDALLRWFLPRDGIFAKVRVHGNTTWVSEDFVRLALFWAWSECRYTTDAFAQAVKCSRAVSNSPVLRTYQGFMGALVRWNSTFIPLLFPQLHQRMREIGGKFWRIHGWVLIAFDGSRSSAPRTKDNEEALCAPNYGNGTTAKYRKKKSKGLRRKKNERSKPQPQEPQAWITMLWHMGLRLPWMWRLGPSNSSERGHVMEMLQAGKFPFHTLFCGDAGFVGYPLWSAILRRNADFLVRVGGNVSLLLESTNYQLQQNGIVLCWPAEMQKADKRPLRLRLVKVRIGKTKVWILTSVLNPARLTDKQIVLFYKMRWGVEIEFRGLKQTLDRRKLCCRNHKRLYAELDWSIMAMAVAELFALKEQLSKKRKRPGGKQSPPKPAKRSLANTIRAIRVCMGDIKGVPDPGDELLSSLQKAVTDSYVRSSSKKPRYRPANPDKKPLGNPKLRPLTNDEKKRLQKLREKMAV